jgi:hypothetical protein
MPMFVMTNMLSRRSRFMLAIARYRCCAYLQRQKNQHENNEKTAHLEDCSHSLQPVQRQIVFLYDALQIHIRPHLFHKSLFSMITEGTSRTPDLFLKYGTVSPNFAPWLQMSRLDTNISQKELRSPCDGNYTFSANNVLAGLVIGTKHAAEALMGFFTKSGDGAYDLAPLTGLNKRLVRSLVKALGATRTWYTRCLPPIWRIAPQRPDEAAFEVTYDEIDNFLEGKEVSPHVFQTVLRFYRSSQHNGNCRFISCDRKKTLHAVFDMDGQGTWYRMKASLNLVCH